MSAVHKRYTTHEIVPQRIQTRDALLTVATKEELAAYFANRAKTDLGQIWDGSLRPLLDAMPADERDAMIKKLQAYATPDGRPEKEFDVGLGASPESINSANTAFW